MRVIVCKDAKELGGRAGRHAAELLRRAVETQGRARLLISTGASQFETLETLTAERVDWSAVELFHLDEYIGLGDTHPASFIKYIRERFVERVGKLAAVHYVDTSGDVQAMMKALSAELGTAPMDVGIIGIGENGHLAFNDPPADFETEEAFKIVMLDEACRRQQHREGWFPTLQDVPDRAVTMTIRQILGCKAIVSAVPHAVKAQAVRNTLTVPEITNLVPATALRGHGDVTLYLDENSASLLEADQYERAQ